MAVDTVPAGESRNVAFAPDSARFAVATANGHILLWSVTNSAPLLHVLATNSLKGLFFAPEARELVALHEADGRLDWFDTATGHPTRTLATDEGGEGSVTITRFGFTAESV